MGEWREGESCSGRYRMWLSDDGLWYHRPEDDPLWQAEQAKQNIENIENTGDQNINDDDLIPASAIYTDVTERLENSLQKLKEAYPSL